MKSVIIFLARRKICRAIPYKDDVLTSYVQIEAENCKGCGLCEDVCPSRQLSLSGKLNKSGYNHIQAKNDDCSGCAFCYYTCPEPGAITVHREASGEESA